ncbi:MAG: type II toxin-antitoxin system HicB family antitoxin [Prolixibacteraceae bacterium]
MQATKKRIKIIVEKTDTGFSGYSDSLPIFTTGKTIPELMANALEATSLYFEDEEYQITNENLIFEIDFKQFFQYYKVLNSKFLAHKIGMNPTLLSQYVQGHKKPSPKQTEKILMGIHQIGRELSEINLIYRK